MGYLLWKIKSLKEKDLQILMQAIEKRYAEAYPDWDVYYIALHKDPDIRKAEIEKAGKAGRHKLE